MTAGRCSKRRRCGRRAGWAATPQLGRAGLLAALCFAAAQTPLAARGQWRETFESPSPTWRLGPNDCRARVLLQQREYQGARSGQGCEHVRLATSVGSAAQLAHPIAPAAVIDELGVGLWIRSDRAGMRLAVRVVLPRTQAPGGGPLTTLVWGDRYDRAGAWRQLTVASVRRRLLSQIPLLRSQFGPQVDAREAYVDSVVLNAYCGPGVTNVWLDDLLVSGYVAAPAAGVGGAAPGAEPAPPTAGGDGWTPPGGGDRWPVSLRDGVLLIDGRPRMLRMVDYNGEPFELLKSLGFDAVCLRATPSLEQLEAARRLGLWLVAPPPDPQGAMIPRAYDRVLAWSLGRRLGEAELEGTRRLAAEVRGADPHPGRPLVCGVASRVWQYSQLADILVIEAPPWGGETELAAFGERAAEQARRAPVGAPFWACLATEPAVDTVAQWRAIDPRMETPALETAQLRRAALLLVAAGARGLWLQSRSPLHDQRPGAARRARQLELLNLELSLIEPWGAAGSTGRPLASGDAGRRVLLLRADRAQLAIGVQAAADDQYVAAPGRPDPWPLVLPAVAADADAYRLSAAGLAPLAARRVAGGLRAAIGDPEDVELLVLANHPVAISRLAQQTAGVRERAAQLRAALAGDELAAAAATLGRMGPRAGAQAAEQRLEQARALLAQANRLLSGRDWGAAHRAAGRALASVAAARRAAWRDAASLFFRPACSPWCVHFDALPLHEQLVARLPRAAWGPNVMAAGDMENLDHMLAVGWRQQRRTPPGVQTAVELAAGDVPQGRQALRLRAWPDERIPPDGLGDEPLVVVAAAPAPVRRGQLARVSFWVNIPTPLEGGGDGLVVVDSFGGPALALRLRHTGGWRRVTFYRAAPRDAEWSVRFALEGLGDAWIDDLRLSLCTPPPAVAGRAGAAAR